MLLPKPWNSIGKQFNVIVLDTRFSIWNNRVPYVTSCYAENNAVLIVLAVPTGAGKWSDSLDDVVRKANSRKLKN